MKHTLIIRWRTILAMALLLLAASCNSKNAQVAEYAIIPEPLYLVQKGRSFTLSPSTKLYFENLAQNTPTAKQISNTFRQMHIRPSYIGTPKRNCITFALNDTLNPALGSEGYLLQVLPEGITLSANTEAGLLYAFETFIQMLPEDILRQRYHHITLPECTILDAPRFAWRGSQLDVCRHFFSTKQIKKHLDLMAAHKLNKFHWHLSDDQGFRIEMERHPELNDIGSWRVERGKAQGDEALPAAGSDDAPYGGYYTKEEIADIIGYASCLNIEVIPEIDLPGHAGAILATYPQLRCGAATSAGTPANEGEGPWALCVGNDQTVELIDDILDEVAQLFPSDFVHIGFADLPIEAWEACPRCHSRIRHEGLGDVRGLQNWLLSHIEDHLSRKGKRIMGWDEMLGCSNLSAQAVVMVGSGDSNIVRGAVRVEGVVNANPDYCDLDTYQADSAHHPTAFPQLLPLSKVYQFDPLPRSLTSDVQSHLWGGEAVLWTTYVRNYEEAEYMLLPRLCALSECFWSQPENKEWGRFRTKIERQKLRLHHAGYNACKGSFKPQVAKTADADGYMVTLSTEVANTYIYYTTDGSDPTPESSIYIRPIHLPKGTRLRTLTLYNSQAQEGIYEYEI